MAALTATDFRDFRVRLAVPVEADMTDVVQCALASRALHHPWINGPLDKQAWQRYLQRIRQPGEAGFLVRHQGDGALCGLVSLHLITWHALCSANISYWAVASRAGRGYMSEGLQLVIAYAFGHLGLHRLEANIQPRNTRSIRLVQSLGFQYEGLSPRLLRIGGIWRDHERWALLADQDQERGL